MFSGFLFSGISTGPHAAVSARSSFLAPALLIGSAMPLSPENH
jgi:hypothetical protein